MIDNVVVLKSNYRIDPWQFDDLIHINRIFLQKFRRCCPGTRNSRKSVMQTPPEIEFQNINPTHKRSGTAIDKHIAELAQRSGSRYFLAGVLKQPSERPALAHFYEMHIDLALPEGRGVHVERTGLADERRAALCLRHRHISTARSRARRRSSARCSC